ncbi:hypothetical protein HDU76_008757, partial [Blyttiomyces sp. JEL0837]
MFGRLIDQVRLSDLVPGLEEHISIHHPSFCTSNSNNEDDNDDAINVNKKLIKIRQRLQLQNKTMQEDMESEHMQNNGIIDHDIEMEIMRRLGMEHVDEMELLWSRRRKTNKRDRDSQDREDAAESHALNTISHDTIKKSKPNATAYVKTSEDLAAEIARHVSIVQLALERVLEFESNTVDGSQNVKSLEAEEKFVDVVKETLEVKGRKRIFEDPSIVSGIESLDDDTILRVHDELVKSSAGENNLPRIHGLMLLPK